METIEAEKRKGKEEEYTHYQETRLFSTACKGQASTQSQQFMHMS